MAKNVKPRVRVPGKAAKGEIIEIKTLISHNMESGRRKGKDGKLIPRSIINKFEVTFNGKPVFQFGLAAGDFSQPLYVDLCKSR